MNNTSESAFRVLISDQDQALRKRLAIYLESRNCEVEHTSSGSNAWARLRRLSYDLVVLEMEMADVNGLELLRLMRRLNPSPVALLVAGWKTDAIERMALALGAEQFLVKPYAFSAVYDLLTDDARAVPDPSTRSLAA